MSVFFKLIMKWYQRFTKKSNHVILTDKNVFKSLIQLLAVMQWLDFMKKIMVGAYVL